MRSRIKKGLLISALLLAGLGAAGCGREGEGLSAAGQGETSAAGRLITVGFSQLGSESDWRIANSESFVNTFTRENGYDLLLENAQPSGSLCSRMWTTLWWLPLWRAAGIQPCRRPKTPAYR